MLRSLVGSEMCIRDSLWNNYLFSKDGTTGPKAKTYDACAKDLCKGYECSASNDAALRKVSCTYTDNGTKTSYDYSYGHFPTKCALNSIGISNYCPKDKGVYTHAEQKIAPFQECCVEAAGLKHPGQPHFGDVDSVCTEITTVSVFVQILVASEFMIFPVRALGWCWTNRASTSLYISIVASVCIFSILAALGVPKDFGPLGDVFSQALGWRNTGFAWCWGLGVTLLLDCIKIAWVLNVDGTTEEIVHERVHDRMQSDQAIAVAASCRDTVTTAVNRTEAALVSGNVGAIGGAQRPANRMTVGGVLMPGRRDAGSLARNLARASRKNRATVAGW
eukprot:TRINITY_DN12581_c0_g3_i1.p1 TRINITY_DN12581_c0_g3~~TRINITY_DN12581_c0_g3_i1.p1  ORF type:complete len:349 (-),score=99.96 TRINITY_DN12581_c0_g3_i1:350-1351(-)